MSPHRGEVWLVDVGSEVQPAVVLSTPNEDAARALATIVPHTTSPRQSRFEASVSLPFLPAGVFDAQSLNTIPHGRFIRQLGALGGAQLAVVERAVRLWLGLPTTTEA